MYSTIRLLCITLFPFWKVSTECEQRMLFCVSCAMRIRCLCYLHFDLIENNVYIDFLTRSAVYIVMPVGWLFCEWVGKSLIQPIRLKKLFIQKQNKWPMKSKTS